MCGLAGGTTVSSGTVRRMEALRWRATRAGEPDGRRRLPPLDRAGPAPALPWRAATPRCSYGRLAHALRM